MRAGFFQTSPEFGSVEKNVEEVVERLRKVSADLVVLPELFSTGYRFTSKRELASLAEEAPGGFTVKRLAEVAKRRRLFIVAGIAEKSGRALYNSSVLVGPKGLAGRYRKLHLFWNEKRLFTPGNLPLEVYSLGRRLGGARVGMMICFDWLFPEAARTLALKGADIVCHPSNLVLPHCPQAMITRSIENRLYAITANRVGWEERVKGERLRFIGQSQVVAPNGTLLCRASGHKEETRVMEMDIKLARDKKITPLNNIFNDRRGEFYEV
ncbi:MAG: nitrilase-related carbon-nitrogen hydrolase [Thermodesulfobacteriota bacterium]